MPPKQLILRLLAGLVLMLALLTALFAVTLPIIHRWGATEAELPAVPVAARSGLGLWMVKRFAHDVGGWLEATTRPCGGTSVRLKIPERKQPSTKTPELSHVA